MTKGLKLNIEIPGNLKKRLKEHISLNHDESIETTVINLLDYALAPYPPYFENYNWKKAEAEADEAIAKGDIKSFDNAEDLIRDLQG